MQKNINLQDVFLNQARKENVSVTIFLVNGVKILGMVRGFDSFTVILDNNSQQMLVYKHAISTIIPAKPINVLSAAEKEE